MRFLSILAIMAPLAAALNYTGPALNSTLTKGSTYDLTWSSVDTDPTTFSIYLVNFVNFPPFYTPLALDVETAAGEYDVRIPCDVDSSYGYQFNAINGTNVYVIYAQSPLFSIGGADCTDPTTSASTCAPAATVTVTVSGSSTLYANNTAPPTVTTTLAARATSYGTCPDTIGWNPPGYGHPITLGSVPHGGQAKITAPPPAASASAVYEAGSYVVYETVYADISECGCM